jgi:hypothetical protein
MYPFPRKFRKGFTLAELGPVNTIGFVLESCNEKHYRRAV